MATVSEFKEKAFYERMEALGNLSFANKDRWFLAMKEFLTASHLLHCVDESMDKPTDEEALNVQFLLKNWVDESIRMQLDKIGDPRKAWNYLQTFYDCKINEKDIETVDKIVKFRLANERDLSTNYTNLSQLFVNLEKISNLQEFKMVFFCSLIRDQTEVISKLMTASQENTFRNILFKCTKNQKKNDAGDQQENENRNHVQHRDGGNNFSDQNDRNRNNQNFKNYNNQNRNNNNHNPNNHQQNNNNNDRHRNNNSNNRNNNRDNASNYNPNNFQHQNSKNQHNNYNRNNPQQNNNNNDRHRNNNSNNVQHQNQNSKNQHNNYNRNNPQQNNNNNDRHRNNNSNNQNNNNNDRHRNNNSNNVQHQNQSSKNQHNNYNRNNPQQNNNNDRHHNNHNDQRKTFQKPCDMNNQGCASNFDHSDDDWGPVQTNHSKLQSSSKCLNRGLIPEEWNCDIQTTNEKQQRNDNSTRLRANEQASTSYEIAMDEKSDSDSTSESESESDWNGSKSGRSGKSIDPEQFDYSYSDSDDENKSLSSGGGKYARKKVLPSSPDVYDEKRIAKKLEGNRFRRNLKSNDDQCSNNGRLSNDRYSISGSVRSQNNRLSNDGSMKNGSRQSLSNAQKDEDNQSQASTRRKTNYKNCIKSDDILK